MTPGTSLLDPDLVQRTIFVLYRPITLTFLVLSRWSSEGRTAQPFGGPYLTEDFPFGPCGRIEIVSRLEPRPFPVLRSQTVHI